VAKRKGNANATETSTFKVIHDVMGKSVASMKKLKQLKEEDIILKK